MKTLGLMPSRPRPSTFPYIPSEAPDISPIPSTSSSVAKSDNVAILPTRPQIHVDLAPSSIAEKFVPSVSTEKTVPLLAQPQSGSQERYYFSSTVTTNSVTNSNPSYDGDAKLAADVIALSSKTPSTSSVTSSACLIQPMVSSSSLVAKPLSLEIIATTTSNSPRYAITEASRGSRVPSDPLPGSVSIFKTTSPLNQLTCNNRLDSQETTSQIAVMDKEKGVLASVPDSAMPYYLDKALTARSQQLLQPSSRKGNNNIGPIGNIHETEVPSGPLQAYLQERAVPEHTQHRGVFHANVNG